MKLRRRKREEEDEMIVDKMTRDEWRVDDL